MKFPDLISKRFAIKSRNMVKLAGLIDGIAAALQVPPSRVRTAAAHLRKHRLLSTGPRGPGALEMSPEDATNLLLAIMYDGELTEAHETVPRLRSAKVAYFEGSRSFDAGGERMTSLPRNGFVTSNEGETYELGTVVDILLDAWVRYGSIDESGDEDEDLEPVNVSLTISCPGYEAHLTFNTPNGLFWRLRYEWKSPEQIDYEALSKSKLLQPRWAARAGPYMSSARHVGEDSLTQVADCLRGAEWDDDSNKEVTPPYQIDESREAVPA